MDKERIKELACNPDFIPGIYNYCDRWCERCTFTAKCMNYALCEEQISTTDSHNIKNELFWKKLEETFKLVLNLLKEVGLHNELDFDKSNISYLSPQDKVKIGKKKENLNLQADPLIICNAKEYIKIVDDWFKSEENIFKEKEEELKLKVSLDILNYNPKEETSKLTEAVKIIHWYQHQIYVKLVRATQGKIYENRLQFDPVQKDSDGSAKVALISIDNSISAWNILREYLSDHDDKIFDILIYLDRMRKDIEKIFPEARAFIRPGFDEIKK
jgi:hypothetical protein